MGVPCLAVRRDKAVGLTGSARRLTQQRAASPGWFRTWARRGIGQGFTEAAARAVGWASHSRSIDPGRAGSPDGLPDQTLIHPGALTLLGRPR
jgi:hypothetical protein